MTDERYRKLFDQIKTLSKSKLELIERTVERHAARIETTVAAVAPFTKQFGEAFGDALQTHHGMSTANLGKDRFEYALIDAFEQAQIPAEDSGSRTRQGYDVQVAGEKWSLKTQGDRGIKADEVYISKFMELGKGNWVDEDDLAGLRDRFMHHMEDYSRIFTLRHWVEKGMLDADNHYYELVEIPKKLLQEAVNGKIEMMHDSRQTPKPGYCSVDDGRGGCKFELYFDGGTERKLQIKHLKKSLCKVIATWKFPV